MKYVMWTVLLALATQIAEEQLPPKSHSHSSEMAEIHYCSIEVPEFIRNGYASFTIIYTFDVGNSGKPENIKPLITRYIDGEEINDCIGQWRLPNIEKGTAVRVVLNWQHAQGWVEMIVRGGELDLKIKLFGNTRPYSRQ